MNVIIIIEKGIQSFIHKFFKYFFQYLITGRLDDSSNNLILNLSSRYTNADLKILIYVCVYL